MKVYDAPEAARWPAPRTGDLYLLRFAGLGRAHEAREELRRELLGLLRGWQGEAVTLRETPRGPELPGCPWRCSISYDGTHAWVALGTFGKLGCDAVLVREFPELSAVARRYLGAAAAERIDASRLRAQTFAHAWAKHEATLKALGLDLTEDAVVPALTCHYHRQTQAVVAVVAE
jgi:phosphopantetheinyl transferase